MGNAIKIKLRKKAKAAPLPFGNDLLYEIFLCLDAKSILQCRQVNRRWNAVIIGRSLMSFNDCFLETFSKECRISPLDRPHKYITFYLNDIVRDLPLILPRHLSITQISLGDYLHSVAEQLLELNLFRSLKSVILGMTPECDSTRLTNVWKTLMYVTTLERIEIFSGSRKNGIVMPVLRSHPRNVRLKGLDLWNVPMSIQDLIFLLEYLADEVTLFSDMDISINELLQILACLIADPRPCCLRSFYITGCAYGIGLQMFGNVSSNKEHMELRSPDGQWIIEFKRLGRTSIKCSPTVYV
ncbi:hypothetical protein QR680_015302 [Steinernema hermaphroditum]|uniref:F-box domain-containing protein n=1 Tax=Steinernema hermaphroditum TaxID=289476 RepID=A0AA39LKL7_9BILA|nr:hypothetical protein QR680_015302 [Steinernema hermaphroditum]